MATVTRERETLIAELLARAAKLRQDAEACLIDTNPADANVEDEDGYSWYRPCSSCVTGVLDAQWLEAAAAALAAPPAEDGEIMAVADEALKEFAATYYRDSSEELAIQGARLFVIERLKAQAPPASDPPGLVALVKETRKSVDSFTYNAEHGMVGMADARGMAALLKRWLAAYPLPASPQASEWRPIDSAQQIKHAGAVVTVWEDGRPYFAYWKADHRYASGGVWQDADREMIVHPNVTHWAPFPASPQAETTKGDE